MSEDEARAVLKTWDGRPPCARYWPGRFDTTWGEPRCVNCAVPQSVHDAHRLLEPAHAS